MKQTWKCEQLQLRGVLGKDPVVGTWIVYSCEEGTVWCDASSLGIEVCIAINGEIKKDVSLLKEIRKISCILINRLEELL